MRRGAAGSPPIVTSPSYNIEELKSFEALCKTAYYEADTLATKLVEQTIRNQSMAGRGAFIKAQSAVRVAYHRDMEVKRRRELEQALAEMDPGSVVRRELGGATTVLAMRSARARHERRTRLARFLSNHALRCVGKALWLVPTRRRCSGRCLDRTPSSALCTLVCSCRACRSSSLVPASGLSNGTSTTRSSSNPAKTFFETPSSCSRACVRLSRLGENVLIGRKGAWDG
jgi:hypothetical protein